MFLIVAETRALIENFKKTKFSAKKYQPSPFLIRIANLLVLSSHGKY